MKKITLLRTACVLLVLLLVTAVAKAQNFSTLDDIPLDISYLRASRVSVPLVKVVYGRPALANEQEELKDKITYGNLWRTGGNEATEIKFYEDVIFGGIKVTAGTYTLFTIPGEEAWEVILNSEVDTWGAFQYNPSANVAQITIPVKKAERVQVFSIGFNGINANSKMVLAWDHIRINIPIQGTKVQHFAKS